MIIWFNEIKSFSVKFVRTAYKAIARRSDTKIGTLICFRDYIFCMTGENLHLESFHVNRLNIIFLNADIILYKDHIKDDLEHTVKEENRPPQSVLGDVKVPEYTAACKALGLI